MSTTREDLITAIRESPEDDNLRLICADWFEEQGGEENIARAEFIRLQIAHANLQPDDPRHAEMEASEMRMLKRHGPTWCGSHFAFKKCRFRRGFIEYVHIHLNHFLHHRRQLMALEPVRDISLTGWWRAKDHLVERVAQCAEWQYVDGLRIHHQGPHKDPRSNVLTLLESPHLTELRKLRMTQVIFDKDARQRFERLPVLRHVEELRFPTLDILMAKPGNWFSDGGLEFAEQWSELTSLTLPAYLHIELLQQFTQMPFWKRLTEVNLQLPNDEANSLPLLRDSLPDSVRRFSMSAPFSPSNYLEAESFFERLAQIPLQTLQLEYFPINESCLRRLLDDQSKCRLKELWLDGYDLKKNHLKILAESRGSQSLRSLNIAGALRIASEDFHLLFSSERLSSLTHLDVSSTQLGLEGATSLAKAPGWTRLRSLGISSINVDSEGLLTLLNSPNLQNVAWLSFCEGGFQSDVSLDFTTDIADQITRLPNLACLILQLRHCGKEQLRILNEAPNPVWLIMDCWNSNDEETYEMIRQPNWPAQLDVAMKYWEHVIWKK